MVEIAVTATSVPDLMQALPGLGKTQRLMLFRSIGMALKQEARTGAHQRHLSASTKSTKGGGFWAKIASSVSYEATADGVTVGATHFAASHKHFGGVISAPGKGAGSTGARYLTIPISDKSRGFTVGQLANRYQIFRFPETNVLGGIKKTAKGLSSKAAIPLFVLKKRVTQRAEPWFPDEGKAARQVSRLLEDLK